MPRIFAPWDLTTTQRLVNFTNGVAAVAPDNAAAIAYFASLNGDGVVVDYSKNYVSALDKMTRADVARIAAYLGVNVESTHKKATIIRNIETSISAKLITSLTVGSAAHASKVGWTTVTVTEACGAGNAFYFKTAKTTPPALLYGDQVDDTWTKAASPFDFELKGATADHDVVSVVEVNEDTLFVYSIGSDTITVNGG